MLKNLPVKRSPADRPPPKRPKDALVVWKETLPAEENFAVQFDPQRYVRRGITVITVLLGGFGGWAAIAPLDSGVVAPGAVIVDGRRRLVQHQEGGVIDQLQVSEGDRVKRDQVLLRLDQTRAGAAYDILQGAYDAALAEEARLIAERDGLNDIAFPSDLTERAGRPEVVEVLEGQRKLFQARQTSLVGQRNILGQQIEQSKKEIEGLTAERASKTKQVALLNDELQGLRELLAEGLAQKTRVLAVERELEQSIGDGSSLDASIARIGTAIGEKELEGLQLQKNLQEQIATELRDTRARLLDSKERLGNARHVLDQIEVRAPIDGIVVNLQANTEGGVIGAGDVIMELVPTNEKLVVDARVAPSDIDLVRPGQRTNVLFTAFDVASTPTLTGEVTHVSADRLVDDQSGQPFYQATVAVSDSEIARLGEGQDLYAGMPADVIIVAGESTMLDYLIRPIRLSFQRAWQE
ncbi:MAG: HlyD family type I secretion periplasmic adaptor subunit [Geminicoccaceae bacterium]